jgi:hypothetical protein
MTINCDPYWPGQNLNLRHAPDKPSLIAIVSSGVQGLAKDYGGVGATGGGLAPQAERS